MEVMGGMKQVQGEAGRRGNVIHEFLKDYVRHLVKMKYRKDLAYFEFSLKGLDPSAREILEPLQEQFEIDPETVFATEQRIGLTEAFVITPAGVPGAAYEMTVDLIELYEETLAKITDYKSQFQAIDPDTFQARLYSLGVMILNPRIEQCEFQLKFLRWGKARSVIFSREQIPDLQNEARMWRERQLALHKESEKAPALPGSHCVYCALLGDGCPVEKNPFEGVESHLRSALYHKMAYDKAREVLKAHADEGGPIRAKDGIGQEYSAEWTITEKKVFTVDVLPCILDWQKKRNDLIIPKLSVSGLSSLLKAKKRADLADEASAYCEMKTGNKFKIGKVGDTENGEDE